MKTISIKDLRANLAQVSNAAMAGQQFTVFKRSKPAFRIVPIAEDEDQWVDFIDFTEDGKKAGMKAEELLKLLKSVDEK